MSRTERNNDRQNLKSKKLFLFDIDGTLSVGDTLYDGSAELLKYIENIGGKSYYITNNSTRSGADYVKKFRDAFRLATTEDLFITSGYMTIEFLKRNYVDSKIFVLGTASFVSELRKNNLQITEVYEPDISCVVVAYDSELNYQKLVEVCRVLSTPVLSTPVLSTPVLSTPDIPFYATNPDLCCPIDFGFIPDCGAICEMITHSTGRVPTYLGKPSKEVVELCLSQSGFSKDETLVVGDRLYTDIACGINGGVDTCVVFTGEATPEDIATTPFKPTYAFDTVRDLLEACLN